MKMEGKYSSETSDDSQRAEMRNIRFIGVFEKYFISCTPTVKMGQYVSPKSPSLHGVTSQNVVLFSNVLYCILHTLSFLGFFFPF
jgi:hypothetical protein